MKINRSVTIEDDVLAACVKVLQTRAFAEALSDELELEFEAFSNSASHEGSEQLTTMAIEPHFSGVWSPLGALLPKRVPIVWKQIWRTEAPGAPSAAWTIDATRRIRFTGEVVLAQRGSDVEATIAGKVHLGFGLLNGLAEGGVKDNLLEVLDDWAHVLKAQLMG